MSSSPSLPATNSLRVVLAVGIVALSIMPLLVGCDKKEDDTSTAPPRGAAAGSKTGGGTAPVTMKPTGAVAPNAAP